MALSVRYYFSQRFNVSAQRAFDWCIDFDPKDHDLMGDANAKRQISHITPDTIILTDVFLSPSGFIEKQKLVQLYPNRLSWTSTQLTGPNKYSQFLYRITAEGKGFSALNFTGLHLEYDEKADAKLLADKLCKEDAAVWKLLAKAMEEEQKTGWATIPRADTRLQITSKKL
jgi:hypothetical protein